MTVSLSPRSNMYVAPGARIQFFVSGTTTPLTVYSDPEAASPLPQTITASTDGRFPAIYLPYQTYKERVELASGALQWENDSVPNPAPLTITGGATPPEQLWQTGDIKCRDQQGDLPGFVLMNGETIGNSSSSATGRANNDCEALFIHRWTTVADAEAPVSGGRGPSAASDWAANKTIALPNMQGRVPIGLYGMGATARSVLAGEAIIAGKQDTPGAFLGASVHTMTIAEMPSHNHGGFTGTQSYSDSTPILSTVQMSVPSGQTIAPSLATGTNALPGSQAGHPISPQGGGVAHNNLPPGLFVSYYMKL